MVKLLAAALLSLTLIGGSTHKLPIGWCSPWLFWLLGGSGSLSCEGEISDSGGGSGGGW